MKLESFSRSPSAPCSVPIIQTSSLTLPLHELHLFAGGGGGILGGMLLGHHPVCAVEIKPFCRELLLQRQRDGILPWFPIWDDVRTFDGKPWKGRVDVVCGGFPCQDISCAGKGAGIEGERSGMWGEMFRIVREVGPRFVFVENSPMLTLRGMGRLLGDLAGLGYDARWGVLGGESVGASQQRGRIWILARNDLQRLAGGGKHQTAPQAGRNGNHHRSGSLGDGRRIATARPNGTMGKRARGGDWWAHEFGVGRVADGMADWLDRQDATGNGQIPAVVARAWKLLESQ